MRGAGAGTGTGMTEAATRAGMETVAEMGMQAEIGTGREMPGQMRVRIGREEPMTALGPTAKRSKSASSCHTPDTCNYRAGH